MNQKVKDALAETAKDFRLPRYEEIPDVGLYLEQVTKYVGDCLAPLTKTAVTGSMISNYVKRGLIANPVKKQYDRDQIAYLIFISVTKIVLSMDDIRLMVSVQKQTYSPMVAYNYFCHEFENVLDYVFGKKDTVELVGTDNTDEKIMLRNTIITVAHKIYLDKLFFALQNA